MSRLSFSVASDVNVPVEIYDSELSLVARRLSSEVADIEPGLYSMVARLPQGGDARASIMVGDDEQAHAVLRETPHRGPWGPPSRPERHVFSGNISSAKESHRYREWLHYYGQAPPSQSPTLFFIPKGHERYFTAASVLRPDGFLESTIGLTHQAADALLGYLQRGLIEDARLLAGSDAMLAEELLFSKSDDPVAAAAGAFALLHLGALDRLHDWTRNLAQRFEWLPDGQVALAEHMARRGEHELARDLLRELPERGIPSLSVGVSYAADRLRAYCQHWPEDKGLQESQRRLAHVAARADVHAKVTTVYRANREVLELWQQRYGM